MKRSIRLSAQRILSTIVGMYLLALIAFMVPAGAINQLPTPDPKPGSYGIEATKAKAPPTRAATISTPGNGASFSNAASPIKINGICQTGLLVEIYDNDVMVGAVMCEKGSYSLKVSLFVGKNELSAIVYDELGQAGPKSKLVTVNYKNTNFESFGEIVTLTSSYGRRSAQVGTSLRWPLQLSGGSGPYAFSIDWGDGSPSELKSQELAGVLAVAHTYKNAGIYQVNITTKDNNDSAAFLQLVAVSSGKVDVGSNNGDESKDSGIAKTEVLWIPTAIAMVLLLPAFWLGRRSQLVSLRNKMLKERDSFEKEQKD